MAAGEIVAIVVAVVAATPVLLWAYDLWHPIMGQLRNPHKWTVVVAEGLILAAVVGGCLNIQAANVEETRQDRLMRAENLRFLRSAIFVAPILAPSSYHPDAVQYRARSFRALDLRGQTLAGLDLEQADFRGSDLRKADLSGANLRHARFDGADLRGADLRNASLRAAFFRDARLDDADLREASLVEATICRTTVFGADFGGTSAHLATWTQAPGAPIANDATQWRQRPRTDSSRVDAADDEPPRIREDDYCGLSEPHDPLNPYSRIDLFPRVDMLEGRSLSPTTPTED